MRGEATLKPRIQEMPTVLAHQTRVRESGGEAEDDPKMVAYGIWVQLTLVLVPFHTSVYVELY